MYNLLGNGLVLAEKQKTAGVQGVRLARAFDTTEVGGRVAREAVATELDLGW